jgi:hypothetical protein
MKKNSLLFIIALLLFNCGNEERYPLEKRYWTPYEYSSVINDITYGYKDGETKPSFNDPDTRAVVEKLFDAENFKVVLDDEELGIEHRNTIAESFFMNWKDLPNAYSDKNRKDQYLYEEELIKSYIFGLELQLRYFDLGNRNILENTDDPNSSYTKNLINSNINTLVNNYTNFLDYVNEEKSFSEKGLILIKKGIDENFSALVTKYPNANYSGIQRKAELMKKKSNNEKIKNSLQNFIDKIKKADL